jgi:hypothetical protein
VDERIVRLASAPFGVRSNTEAVASRRATKVFMMNQTNHWMGGGMWGWTVVGTLLVVLLVVAIVKVAKK